GTIRCRVCRQLYAGVVGCPERSAQSPERLQKRVAGRASGWSRFHEGVWSNGQDLEEDQRGCGLGFYGGEPDLEELEDSQDDRTSPVPSHW
ncbi:hypothetical protein DSO57_1022170, partial [Entomophthora muscae]